MAIQRTIPAAVLRAASPLIEMYGKNLDYLGKKNGAHWWYFKFPADVTVGFPTVYRYANQDVSVIGSNDAVAILSSFLGIED